MCFRSFSNLGDIRYVYKQTKELNLPTEYFKSFSTNTTCTSLPLATRRPKPVSLNVLTEHWKSRCGSISHRETLTYVDVLSEMVASYYHTVHRTIGIPPAEVTWANQTTESMRLYGRKGPKKSCKFSPGDRVRLSKAKRTFKKRYLPNWTKELFTVVKCIETRPQVYLVKDDHGEILEGTIYAEEI
jgi:hypothetical protein